MTLLHSNSDQFYECSFPLVQWACGTDLWCDLLNKVNSYVMTLQHLNKWKNNGLVFLKPTLSSKRTIIFWIHNSVLSKALELTGIRGGYKPSTNKSHIISLSNRQQKRKSNRSQRVLLDLGCDSPGLITKLRQCGLEVSSVWDCLSDLYHYELIEQCLNHHFDFLVSKNERLFTPNEEWMQYLLPRKTKLLIVPSKNSKGYKYVLKLICQNSHNKEG